jgi:hypothetical protein
MNKQNAVNKEQRLGKRLDKIVVEGPLLFPHRVLSGTPLGIIHRIRVEGHVALFLLFAGPGS